MALRHPQSGNFKAVQLGSFTADLAALFRSTIENSLIEFEINCDTTSPVLSFMLSQLQTHSRFPPHSTCFRYIPCTYDLP
ncbi:hypothetical protein JB92DRAFT_1820379 [Gautieria morchelliformis]|nr:hypothetical protein JB92DRAFT_1820379 [Gautieria morchelliformis]